jgi:hypothetical protein
MIKTNKSNMKVKIKFTVNLIDGNIDYDLRQFKFFIKSKSTTQSLNDQTCLRENVFGKYSKRMSLEANTYPIFEYRDVYLTRNISFFSSFKSPVTIYSIQLGNYARKYFEVRKCF